MPLTRLIRPCHPKNLSVNHLYPIEFKPVWVTSASFNKLSHDFHSSNWGLSQLPTLCNSFNKIVGLYPNNCRLSQLPTLCNSFNKIVGLYQESPTWVHYFTSWTKDCSWRDSNPRPLNCFCLPHLMASSLALYRLSYRSLCSVRDSNPRSVMVCVVNI